MENKRHLIVANYVTKKIYKISYYNCDNFKETIVVNDSKTFFAVIELLHATKRSYEYKIVEDGYWTIK